MPFSVGRVSGRASSESVDDVSCEGSTEMFIAIFAALCQPLSGYILPEGVACRHLIVAGAPLDRTNGIYRYDEDRSVFWPNSSASAGRPGYVHASHGSYIYASNDFRTPSWVIRDAIQL